MMLLNVSPYFGTWWGMMRANKYPWVLKCFCVCIRKQATNGLLLVVTVRQLCGMRAKSSPHYHDLHLELVKSCHVLFS